MQQPLLATAAVRHGISQDQRGLAVEQVVYSRNYGNWKHVSCVLRHAADARYCVGGVADAIAEPSSG
jgi:hypothetical protein